MPAPQKSPGELPSFSFGNLHSLPHPGDDSFAEANLQTSALQLICPAPVATEICKELQFLFFLTIPEQESGYAKIYVPCYEKDKILVFAVGSGEDTEDDDGW